MTATTTTTTNSSTARPRAPSSRHFSTSVSTGSSGDEKSVKEMLAGNGASNGVGATTVHPLRNTWVFWFRQQRAPGNKTVNYEEGIKKISTFGSVESFWSLWTHLNPPSTLQPTTDYLLFHSGVRRPVWEDPLNIEGGKWIIRFKKGVADRLWEEIVMAIVGDQFDDCGPNADVGSWRGGTGESGGSGNANGTTAASNDPEICGCTLSVRQHEDILSVWNKHVLDSRANQKVKDTIKKVLDLPPNTVIEYKSNNDSMQDKSSFRNPQVDRADRIALP
ncbi:eukaryotic translation initiation factor 4E member 2 [Phellopilus nigrolimitatus]|nr:eukaryotic translation initiation factor 4E member 2 [Phellopilus nigrolimitatus]